MQFVDKKKTNSICGRYNNMKLYNILYVVKETPEACDIVSGETYHFQIRLLPESIIYRAHFPEEPITPGACLVGIVKELTALLLNKAAEEGTGTCREVSVTNVKNLKFLVPVRPKPQGEDSLVDVDLKITELAVDVVSIQGTLSSPEATYTKMSLRLAYS